MPLMDSPYIPAELLQVQERRVFGSGGLRSCRCLGRITQKLCLVLAKLSISHPNCCLFTHHPLLTLSPLGTCSHPALSLSSCGLTSIFILNLFPHIVLCQLPWTALEK